MLFAPIIERELRLSARDWRTYYSRVLVGVWALGLCLYFVIVLSAAFGGTAAGAQILTGCSMMALALCLFNGINRTADCLSVEKREDTLGLLFLTRLKSRDIILGKLVANGLRTVYLLIAITPILAIPLFLGGVSGIELLRVPVLLLNSLLLALSLGLLVSSLGVAQRVTHGCAAAAISVLAFVLPAAGFLVDRFAHMPALGLALNLPSPTYALRMSAGNAFGLSANFFWSSLALQFAMAVTALAMACWLLPHFWKIKGARGFRFKTWLARIAHGNGPARAKRRFRMLGRNAIYWLNSRDRFAVFGPAIFAAGSFAIAAGFAIYFDVSAEARFTIAFLTLALNDFGMRIRVGTIASLQLGNDRQNGALEMILSTPLSVREIVSGIWKAIRQKLLWTYVPLLLVYLAVVAIYIGPVIDEHWVVAGFFVIFSAVDFIAMGYVAMWNGMRMRNVQQAAGRALLRVLVLPWAVWAGVMPFAVQFPFEIGGPTGFALAVMIWGLSTGTAIYRARRKLFAHFREAATDRYNFEQRTGLMPFARRIRDNFLTVILLQNRRPGVLG